MARWSCSLEVRLKGKALEKVPTPVSLSLPIHVNKGSVRYRRRDCYVIVSLSTQGKKSSGRYLPQPRLLLHGY